MRYQVLNDLFWSCADLDAAVHYRAALSRRGWVPDYEDYVKRKTRREREALEERGPRHEGQIPEGSRSSPYRERQYDPSMADVGLWAGVNREPVQRLSDVDRFLVQNAMGRHPSGRDGWDDD